MEQNDVLYQEEEQQEKKRRGRLLDIILIIIIIILLLLLFWFGFQIKKFNDQKTSNSTGDIFEIDCECNQNNDSDEDSSDDNQNPVEDYNTNGTNDSTGSTSDGVDDGSNSNDSGSIDNGSDSSDTNGQMQVSDEDILWQDTNQLRIFKNPVYQMDEVIAPGSSNEYRFTIKNKTTCGLEYELNFIENNPYDVNMKYKLKRNGVYLVSDYVSISEIVKVVNKLDAKEQDDYVLEWKWVDSDRDTEVGVNIEASYHLSIEIIGKQNI